MWTLAQLAAESVSTPENALLTYGPLGVFAALMVVVLRSLFKREQDGRDRAEQEVARLNAMQAEKLIPALINAGDSVRAAQTLLAEMDMRAKVAEEASRLALKNGGGK